MIRAVIRNRNIILFLSCNNNHCYVAEAYDYRPSKRFPESLPCGPQESCPFLFANNSIIGNPTKELCNLIY